MNVEALSILEWARLGVSGVLILAGLMFVLGGALGLLRFPDFYTRLHAVGVSDGVGAVLVLAGLAVASWDVRIAVKLGLLAALLMAAGPVISQVCANAAHAAGLAPLSGPYVAPRPGAPARERQP